ncbi:MAG: hypothetical protein ABFC57_16125, partial [Veillonellales bacterium]
AGNTLKVRVASVGTGENLGDNIFESFNFTSGWMVSPSASVVDADTFKAITNDATWARPTVNLLVSTKLYKGSYDGVSSNGKINRCMDDSFGTTYLPDGSSEVYFTAKTGYFFVFHSSNATDQTLDVSTLAVQQVTAPSATGIYFTNPVVTGTFNYNAASFTAVITKE